MVKLTLIINSKIKQLIIDKISTTMNSRSTYTNRRAVLNKL